MRPFKLWIFAGLTVLMMLCAATGAHADELRDPFSPPGLQVIPRDYPSAIGMVNLKGIVRTETFEGCLVEIGGTGTEFVLMAGRQFSVPYDGLPHQFAVSGIREKSVVFSDNEGGTYEVEIR
jgi:hypothetical protein